MPLISGGAGQWVRRPTLNFKLTLGRIAKKVIATSYSHYTVIKGSSNTSNQISTTELANSMKDLLE